MEEQLPFFVYGTLRPGEKNYPGYLQGRTVREVPATAAGSLYYVEEGGYPYVKEGGGTVRGDLVEIDPKLYGKTMRDLDALEEYNCDDDEGSVYVRRRAEVVLPGGKTEEAWIYYWNCPNVSGTKIESGDFRNR